jgi:hypothetical protein
MKLAGELDQDTDYVRYISENTKEEQHERKSLTGLKANLAWISHGSHQPSDHVHFWQSVGSDCQRRERQICRRKRGQ